MGFNLSAWAVRERALTLFLILAVALSGAYAFLSLGRAEDPAFTIKGLTVTAVWPGATAREMQDLVADPIEKKLQELRYFDKVETFTRPGYAFVSLNLRDTMPPSAKPEAFYQARKKMGDVARDLPRGALGPFVNDEFGDVDFAVYAVKAPGMAPRDLTREAEALRQKFLAVPGVKKVEILGERPERIFVDISYRRLATLGITAPDILDALSRQNLVTPSGVMETTGPRVEIRVDRGFDNLDQIRDVTLTARGHSLRLGDIAEVRRGYEDPPTYLIRHDGEPAMLLGLVMQEGWNGLALGKSLDATETQLRAAMPLGLTLSKVSDQARNIREAVDEFMLKFFVALAVVLVVSFGALGLRGGLVVAAAVPLTLGAVFVVMLITGRNFDRITLGALILSLGLLVDDAIIAIEMMVVKMEEGLDRVAAASFAWTVTAAPMLSGTLITIIGFLPIGFAQSSAGEYAGNIFWIVAFALIISWLVAVVFTPYLGVRLLRDVTPNPGGHDGIYATPRYQRLRAAIRWCVDHRGLVAGLTLGAFALAVVGMGVVPKQFFPNSDRPELLVEVYEPEGTAVAVTTASVARVEAVLRHDPDVEYVTSYVGQGAARFFLSLNPELPDPAFGKLVVQTRDAAARDRVKARIRQRIADGLAPEAHVRLTQLLFGPPVPWPVAFRVVGPDPDRLRVIAQAVATRLRSDPETRDVNMDWGEKTPGVRVRFDAARLRQIGLTSKDAADQLAGLLSGAPATFVREDVREVEVDLRATTEERRDLGHVGDIDLITRDGRAVPLSSVGTLVVEAQDPILKRRNREPAITVRCDIADGLQPPDVTAALLPKLAEIRATLPPGYRIDTAGSVEESGKANGALVAVFPVMLLLMLFVLMVQVRSFSMMIMVFLTAPLGLVGAVPALLIFHQPFGFNAILGLIGLAGILIRNTLILTEQIKADKLEGRDDYHAVIEATVRRARPVILTALAAVLAFIPLTLSSFWGPLAFVLIGGTAVGTVLTLLFLPALYALWFRVRRTGDAA